MMSRVAGFDLQGWRKRSTGRLAEERRPLRKTSLDMHGEAAAALMANAATAELREIRSMAVRLGKLLRRLEKFSFPLVAAPVAGLLTRAGESQRDRPD